MTEKEQKTSNEEKIFIEKVLGVQTELKAPKGQFNTFGKYHYRSAEDILTAVKPLNNKYGLMLTLTDKPVLVGDRYYIEATANLTDGEKEQVVTAYARESFEKKGMDDSQITGTASSYARKYALNGLYLIDDIRDADTDEFSEDTRNNQPPQQNMNNGLINGKQLAKMRDEARKIANISGATPDVFIGKICEMANIQSIENLSANDYGLALAELVKWKQGYLKRQTEAGQAKQNEQKQQTHDSEQTALFNSAKPPLNDNNSIPWGQKQ